MPLSLAIIILSIAYCHKSIIQQSDNNNHNNYSGQARFIVLAQAFTPALITISDKSSLSARRLPRPRILHKSVRRSGGMAIGQRITRRRSGHICAGNHVSALLAYRRYTGRQSSCDHCATSITTTIHYRFTDITSIIKSDTINCSQIFANHRVRSDQQYNATITIIIGSARIQSITANIHNHTIAAI